MFVKENSVRHANRLWMNTLLVRSVIVRFMVYQRAANRFSDSFCNRLHSNSAQCSIQLSASSCPNMKYFARREMRISNAFRCILARFPPGRISLKKATVFVDMVACMSCSEHAHCHRRHDDHERVADSRSTLTAFRINTCKSVSKQRTLATCRMNIYEKQEGAVGLTAHLFRVSVESDLSGTEGSDRHVDAAFCPNLMFRGNAPVGPAFGLDSAGLLISAYQNLLIHL